MRRALYLGFPAARVLAVASLALDGCAGSPGSLHAGGEYVIGDGGSVKWELNGELVEINVRDRRLVVVRNETRVALPDVGIPAEFELELTGEVLALRFRDGTWFTWRDDLVTYAGKEHRLASPGLFEINARGDLHGPTR